MEGTVADKSQFTSELEELLDSSKTGCLLGIEDTLSDSKFIVPTGLIPLDILLGGGIPSGRIIEIYGAQSHGKSTLCDCIAIAWQKSDPKAVIVRIESESTLDKIRFSHQGGDLSRLIIKETLVLEEGYNQIEKLSEQIYKKYGEDVRVLFVWDTLTAAAPEKEVEGDAFAGGMMESSRINTREIRKLNNVLSERSQSMIIIQQIRQSMDGGNDYETTGGEALKHFVVARLEVSRRDPIFDPQDQHHIIGNIIEIKARKNKLTGMEDSCQCKLMRLNGMDKARSTALYASSSGKCSPYITLGGGGYFIIRDHNLQDYKKVQGLAKLEALVEEDPYVTKLVEFAAYNWYSNYHEIFAEKFRNKIIKLKEELDKMLVPVSQ